MAAHDPSSTDIEVQGPQHHKHHQDGDYDLKSSLIAEAKSGAIAEQSMSLGTALRLYPKAILWSVLLSSTLIMEGYDLALLGNLYASQPFNRKYGTYNPSTKKYTVSAAWQSGLSNGARAGEIIGLILAGWTVDRWGYKKSMVLFLALMIAFVFVLVFAPSVGVLVAGEVLCGKFKSSFHDNVAGDLHMLDLLHCRLCAISFFLYFKLIRIIGIPWGAFQSITPAYASEVAPVVLRPYLTTFINMCWVIGQFFAAAVNKGSNGRTDEWAYRIPFAVQWVWPVPVLAGVLFAPE